MITSSTKSRHFGHHFPGFFSKVLCSTTHMQVPYPKSKAQLVQKFETEVGLSPPPSGYLMLKKARLVRVKSGNLKILQKPKITEAQKHIFYLA